MLLLQQGGFSEVHLAQDKLTGKTVALKVVFLNKGGLTKDQVGVGGLLGVPSRGIAGWLQQQAVWAAAAGVCGCGKSSTALKFSSTCVTVGCIRIDHM
jgi:hypothetical protein